MPLNEELDTSVAHSARLWNYLLGGKDNFAADREAAEQVARLHARAGAVGPRQPGSSSAGPCGTWPARPASGSSSTSAPACRPPTTCTRWRRRSPRLAGSSTSTTTRWCSSHARALLTSAPRAPPTTSTPTCATRARSCAEAAATLDFSRPVAIMLLGIVNFVVDDDEAARGRRATLIDAVPSGSYLVMSHPTREVNAAAVDRAVRCGTERRRADGGARPAADRRLLHRPGAPRSGRRHLLAVAPRRQRHHRRPPSSRGVARKP